MRTSPWVKAVYLGPAVVVMAAACLYPVLAAFQLGLYDWSMGTPWSEARWAGLANFASAFSQPRLWSSLATTLLFAAVCVASEMLLGIAKNLAELIKPILSNAMGRAGENFALMFFPARTKSGNQIADATTKGSFTVVLKDAAGEPETIYLWRTPLTSFSTPRYCPAGKERVHANWDYCPWHGVKLDDKP